MSTTKEREFVVTGTTIPLVDGEPRRITLVGIVTETTDDITQTSHENISIKDGYISATTVKFLQDYKATLAIGLAVVNPLDDAIATLGEGVRRARGRATKEGAALLTLSSKDKVFYADAVQNILEFQLQRVINNPNRFIKVSPRKEAKEVA